MDVEAEDTPVVVRLLELVLPLGSLQSVHVGSAEVVFVEPGQSLQLGSAEVASVDVVQSDQVGSAAAVSVDVAQSDHVGSAEPVSVELAQSDHVGWAEVVSVEMAQSLQVGSAEGVSVDDAQSDHVGSAELVSVKVAQSMNVRSAEWRLLIADVVVLMTQSSSHDDRLVTASLLEVAVVVGVQEIAVVLIENGEIGVHQAGMDQLLAATVLVQVGVDDVVRSDVVEHVVVLMVEMALEVEFHMGSARRRSS